MTTAPAPGFTGWAASNLWVDRSVRNGKQYSFTFPPEGDADTVPPKGDALNVWDTDIYTHASSVCIAAVHAVLIDFEDGGAVVKRCDPVSLLTSGPRPTG